MKANLIQQLMISCKDSYKDRLERLNNFSKVLGYRVVTSKDLSEIEMFDLIRYHRTGEMPTPTTFAYFDKDNIQHKKILSLVRQLGWIDAGKSHASLHALGCWLRSSRCPVQSTPLKQMSPKELSKVIAALEQMVIKKFVK